MGHLGPVTGFLRLIETAALSAGVLVATLNAVQRIDDTAPPAVLELRATPAARPRPAAGAPDRPATSEPATAERPTAQPPRFYVVASDDEAAFLRDALGFGDRLRLSLAIEQFPEFIIVAATSSEREAAIKQILDLNPARTWVGEQPAAIVDFARWP